MIMSSKCLLMYVCPYGGYLEEMSKVVYSNILEFAVCWHKFWVGEQLLRCYSSSRCCNIWGPLCSCIIWQGRAEGTEIIFLNNPFLWPLQFLGLVSFKRVVWFILLNTCCVECEELEALTCVWWTDIIHACPSIHLCHCAVIMCCVE